MRSITIWSVWRSWISALVCVHTSVSAGGTDLLSTADLMWEQACSHMLIRFTAQDLRPVCLDFLIALFQLLANLPALLGLHKPALVFAVLRLQRRHGGRFALVIHRDHGEEAAIGMAHRTLADVLGDHLDPHFHRRVAGVVDRSQEGHQLADMDW